MVYHKFIVDITSEECIVPIRTILTRTLGSKIHNVTADIPEKTVIVNCADGVRAETCLNAIKQTGKECSILQSDYVVHAGINVD